VAQRVSDDWCFGVGQNALEINSFLRHYQGMDRRLVQISKTLSRHLRHQPEALGLHLKTGGWVDVDALLEALSRKGFNLSREELDQVVAQNDKQRFSFDQTRTHIRANQGHSVQVDLELTVLEPPETLYHGTNDAALETIFREGLQRMSRHHVHLSPDTPTAVRVGSRRGKAVILRVRALEMHRAGFVFYRSHNGVWLTDHVPPSYLERA
jgi:putative RNA 2'-phosphotransferase